MKTTFGDSQSALMLAEILDNRPTFKKKVSAMIHEFNTVRKEIVCSNLPKYLKKSFLDTSLERFKKKASKLSEQEVKTFTLNVIKQNYRKSLNNI